MDEPMLWGSHRNKAVQAPVALIRAFSEPVQVRIVGILSAAVKDKKRLWLSQSGRLSVTLEPAPP